jgi:peptidoglycan/xylan/chitin deacetylase (PgdA/CDA1 family)
VRRSLKRAAEFGLVVSGATRLARSRRAGDILVLAYHNIVPEGERVAGDTSLHLPQREFGRQLDLLRQTHDVIAITELAAGNARRKPRAVITFDDAYAGALEAGTAELKARGLPATIFVTPSFVGGASFWWDRFAPADGQGLEPWWREQALNECRGVDAEITAWAASAARPEQTVPSHQRGASEADLRRAENTGLITFGSHTWSHANLARLSATELAEELVRPLEWLQQRFAQALPLLAYPYGRYTPEVIAAVRRHGYRGAFRIDGGWITRSTLATSPYEVPRWNVPAGISMRGFEIRTSGVIR